MFSNGSLTEEQSYTTAGLLYVLNDIARVSKRCEDASPVIRAKLEGKYKFSKDAVEELGKVIDNVEIMYTDIDCLTGKWGYKDCKEGLRLSQGTA